MKISVVVPCYNEQETVERFYQAATPVLSSLDNMDYEIIFVNDGSKDNTKEKLAALASSDSKVKVINFSRNFGQQPAILCGFRHATGDCAVELDCDLQDPVEVIPVMVEKFKEGYDVVHGRRIARKGETLFKKVTASIYYKFLAKISSVDMPRNTGDFKLLSRKVLDVIVNLPEHEKYLRGLESWVGFRQTFVDFERKERVAGQTHYTLKKMMNLAKAGIVANSNYPLSLSFKLGLLGSILSVLCFITFIVLACLKITLPLTAWLFPTIALGVSVLLLSHSITNLYLGRVYDEVKNRPEYIVDEKINLD